MDRHRTHTLASRVLLMFSTFSAIILTAIVISLYHTEYSLYKDLRTDKLVEVNRYICDFLERDGADFVEFVNLTEKYQDDMEVNYGSTEYHSYYDRFYTLFSEKYPGCTVNVNDIPIESLDHDVLVSYLEYRYAYYLVALKDAMSSFDLIYCYMIKPDDSTGIVSYVLDTAPPEGMEHSNMDVWYQDPPEDNSPVIAPQLWDTWHKGEEIGEFAVYDNEWGHVYSYFTPVIIDGVKVGLISSEIPVSSVYRDAVIKTLSFFFGFCFIFLLCVVGAYYFLKVNYVDRLTSLSDTVKSFSESKDYSIADRMASADRSCTEIDNLYDSISSMIREIEHYFNSYTEAKTLFTDAKSREVVASQMALKDPLTGAYNKLACDTLFENLDNLIQNGEDKIGIAMIDLNYLKKINDTYGHSKGNTAIKRLYDILKDFFDADSIFRIGGDEFVVVITGDAFKNIDTILHDFRKKIRDISEDPALKPWERTSAAIGYASFDYKSDRTIHDVFLKADNLMYKEKKSMKALRE